MHGRCWGFADAGTPGAPGNPCSKVLQGPKCSGVRPGVFGAQSGSCKMCHHVLGVASGGGADPGWSCQGVRQQKSHVLATRGVQVDFWSGV